MLRKFFIACLAVASSLQAEDCFVDYAEPRYCELYDTVCGLFWADAEYLYWKVKDSPEPVPLLVEIPLAAGPNKVVLGGHKIDNEWRSGGKFSLGYWFDDSRCYGLEGIYFFLPQNSYKKSVSSNGLAGSPHLATPYFDVTTGQEAFVNVAVPTQFAGTATLKLRNSMQGFELNILRSLSTCDCAMNFEALFGFRYWNFDEHLTFATDSPYVPPNPSDVFITKDKFRAENNFYGAQIGGEFEYDYCSFYLNIKGKLALGAITQHAIIHGHLLTNDFNNFGTSQEFTGGYLTMPSNIGHHKQTRFAVLPEINLNVGYEIMDGLRLQVGYSFLYVSSVLWAGKEIDPNINPTQSAAIAFTPNPVLVGEALPKAKHRSEDLWVQGLNAGIEFRF